MATVIFPSKFSKDLFTSPDALVQKMENHTLGESTAGFEEITKMIGVKALFKHFEDCCQISEGGLFGTNHAKQFALTVYEGATYNKLTPREITGSFIGAYLYVLTKSFVIKQGYMINAPAATVSKFDRILSDYEKEAGSIDFSQFDVISGVILRDVFGPQVVQKKKVLLHCLLEDAMVLSLLAGEKEQIQIKTAQFSNFLMNETEGVYDSDSMKGFSSLQLVERMARSSNRLEIIMPYLHRVYHTRWGMMRNYKVRDKLKEHSVFSVSVK